MREKREAENARRERADAVHIYPKDTDLAERPFEVPATLLRRCRFDVAVFQLGRDVRSVRYYSNIMSIPPRRTNTGGR